MSANPNTAESALQPVVLEGTIVRLEPLARQHVDGLCAVGLAPELWQWTTTMLRNRADMEQYVTSALELQAAGTALPFVTVLKREERIIGSTRFANYDGPNRRVEIGWTWLAPAAQRSGANLEAKLLMLQHAFEVVGCNRVEFKTDVLNEKSRRALKGIDAREEGILRSHMVLWNGRIRDTVYYSVIRPEWPEVQTHLFEKLRRRIVLPAE